MPDEFVSIDLETTGLNLETDEITEIGATRFDRSGHAESYSTFVNPGRPIPPEIQRITSITDADVAGAPRFEQVAGDLIDFVGDLAIVGQNVQFDIGFLTARDVHFAGPTYDTWELASVLLPRAERLNLATLAESLGIAMPVAHRALADAETTRDVFLELLLRLEALPRPLLLDLHTFAARSGWGLTTLIEPIIAGAGGSPGELLAAADVEAIAARLAVPPSTAPDPVLEPAEQARPVTEEEIDALFAAAARRDDLFPGYERRLGQEEMSRAVARTMAHGGHLAVEAGTGTGKSLAYLLPALLHALRNGDRVVVSTHTRNLQEQLIEHDIPLAAALVEQHEGAADGAVRAVMLKGRGNYLCLDRWAQTRVDPRSRSEAEARLFSRVTTWLPGTESGDVAELYMTSQEEPAWSEISADGSDCLARRCSYVREGTCFLLRARQRAAAAHVVVVNHALLMANAARDDQVLPPFRHLVLDEAHRVEEVATDHYSTTLSLRELRDRLDEMGGRERHGDPGLARRILAAPLGGAQALSPTAGLSGDAEAVAEAAGRARERIQPLARALRNYAQETAEGEEQRSGAQVPLSAARRSQPAWEDVEETAMQLDVALHYLGERLGRLRGAFESLADGAVPQQERLRADTLRAMQLTAESRATLGAATLRIDRELIVWLTVGQGEARLSTAPLAVAGRLAEELYEPRDSVIATSATLATQGSFDFSVGRLGLFEPETLTVPSPFDFRRAALVIVVDDMPEPGWPGYDRAVQEVLIDAARATGGRTLGLFTSHGALRAAADGIRATLAADGITVLAQRVDGSPARLLRALQEDPRTVLLGTAAFWEGIDVPGEALTQIAVARLPFPVPADPIYAGRAEQYADPFNEYALPQAVLRFRQGFGRLIRNTRDRGVFLILDSRVLRRRYGDSFLDGLPDCEVRTMPAAEIGPAVERWLRA